MQTSLNKLGTKCAIFFEFRHYKVDKKKVRGRASTRVEGGAYLGTRTGLRSVEKGYRQNIFCHQQQ